MDSSLRIIICLLKIPTTNATRVSSQPNFKRRLQNLAGL